jgi:Bacterial Ig domain
VLYDSTTPVTSVRVPSDGATVRGTNVALTANASVPLTYVTRVRFVLSGEGQPTRFIGNQFFPRFSFWNSTTVPNGTYSLRSLATSGAGRSSYSPAITITVDN